MWKIIEKSGGLGQGGLSQIVERKAKEEEDCP